MRHTALAIACIAVPALLGAQSSANAHGDISIPDSYSEFARERITAAFKAAHAKHVPDDQLRQRLSEGQARGATDVQVASAVRRTEERLEAAQALLIRVGREHPEPEEITNAEQAIERGATEAEVEATVKNPAASVGLAAALSALAQPTAADTGAVRQAVGAKKP